MSIKALSRINKTHGMRIDLGDNGGYHINQEEAIGELLRTNGMADANSMRSPIGMTATTRS